MALEFAHGAIRWNNGDGVGITYTVSGLSFQPKAIRFYWMGQSNLTDGVAQTLALRRGVGFASGVSSRRAVASFSADGAGTSDCGSVASNDCAAIVVNGAGGVDGKLDLNAINSDGFQMIVDDSPLAGLMVFWEAWGGDDITDVTIGDIAEPAAGGTQNYTAAGFANVDNDSQVVMLAGVQSTAALNTGQATDSGFFVGFSTGVDLQDNIFVVGNSDDASGTMDTDGRCGSLSCLAMIVLGGGSINAEAAVSAFGTDLFTLNWTNRTTTNRRSIYMAIKGGAWRASDYVINGNSAGATATISGLPFTPKGISLIGRDTTAFDTVNDRMSLGSGTSTTSRNSMGALDVNTPTISEIYHVIEYDQVLAFPSNSSGLQSAYDINAMNSDGFQIIVDVAGGVASEWQGYLTFGDAPEEGVVENDSTLQWGMLAATTADSDIRWDLLASLLSDSDLRWGMLAAAESNSDLRWDVVEAVVQVIVPIEDVTDGTWSPSSGTELYQMLDEQPADDDDYIHTSGASMCEVRFAAASDPSSSTGHVVSYRARGDGATDLIVKLMEGTTQIAAWTETAVPVAFTLFQHTLSGAEADAIGDYSNLRLRFEAA